VEPNAGHLAIVELQKLGKLSFLVSQNVDNLHLWSGIRADLLAELHGNVTKLRCGHCEFLPDNLDDQIACPLCGGKLVSSVVNFGQSLPRKELADSYCHSQHCDLLIVAGSSLVVMPAADMPKVAVQSGAKLVIINKGETPLDRLAHLRFEERTGEALPPAVHGLKELMGDSLFEPQRSKAMRDVIEKVLRLITYSQELGLDLKTEEDRFKWFLASILFAKRISSEVAKRTYREFEKVGIVTP